MDAIPTPIETLLDVFSTHLADVRFGDVDAKTLMRVAAEVKSASDVVASAQAALDAARETLQERQDALLQQAQRAVAYARVYAENDEELSARIEAISLPRPARSARRVLATSESLVLSPDPPPTGPGARRASRARPRNPRAPEPTLEGVSLTGE